MTEPKFIPLMVPDIQQQDIDAVVAVLKTGMLVQGEKVSELENKVAKYLDVKHAIAASSGTATLHLALLALGIGKGDEVIVPAFSYIATANVVELVGARPVFVDIDVRSYNIDTHLIEQAITPETKAIMPVHEFGLACDIDEVCRLAGKYNLFVIEDAACALGATADGKYAGTFGDAGSFSFHPRKAITSGEGGMLVTNNPELAARLRTLRNHGMMVQHGKTEFIEAGLNYRMTEFQAALVESQFQRLENTFEKRNELARIYFKNLDKFNMLTLPYYPDNKRHTWQSFHILLHDSLDRDQMIEKLKALGIGTNLGAQCMPYQQFFRKKYQLNCQQLFPNAMKAYKQGLVLPLYSQLNAHHLEEISNTLKKTMGNEYA